MENIQDLLSSFFTNDKKTKQQAKKLNVPVSQVADLTAYRMARTDEGANIYRQVIAMAKMDYADILA